MRYIYKKGRNKPNKTKILVFIDNTSILKGKTTNTPFGCTIEEYSFYNYDNI